MQHRKLRADRCPRIINRIRPFDYKQVRLQHRYRRTQQILHFIQQSHEVSELAVQHWETSCWYLEKLKTKIKNEDTDLVQGNLMHDLPEWLEEFTENLVDDKVPALRDTLANSSRESDPEPSRKVVSGQHSIHTHFPMQEDRDYKGCLQKTHW